MRFVLDLSKFDAKMSEIRSVLARPVLFVSGAPKSGTTWLQKALNAHPQIVCSGEGHFINSLLPVFQQGLEHYSDQLGKVAEQVYQGEAFYQPFREEDQIHLMRCMVALMWLNGRQGLHPETLYVGDKTPAYALFMPQLHLLFPHARFVHIIRDVRDVVVSTLKHAERFGTLSQQRPAYIEGVVQRWLRYNQEAMAFGKKYPQQFHWLRYWELLYHFEPTLKNVLAFLDVEADAEIVAKCKLEADFKTLSGGRENGVEDNASFYRKGIRGDWKNHLTREEEQLILSSCEPLLTELGFMEVVEPEGWRSKAGAWLAGASALSQEVLGLLEMARFA